MRPDPEETPPLLFDLAKVPWKTTWSDWVLCLCPDQGVRVWIEHDVLVAMFPDAVRYSEEYHDGFTAIGARVASLLASRTGLVVLEGMVRPIAFAANPVDLRVGRFGGEVFVFLPRPEFERSS